jgi:hypothetical protein
MDKMDVFQMYNRAEKLVQMSDNIRYGNISIGQALKIPFVDYLSMHSQGSKRIQYVRLMGRKIGVHVYHIVFGWILHNVFRRPNTRPDFWKDKNMVVVVDHSGHMISMGLELMEKFDRERTVVLTISPTVYRRMCKTPTNCVFFYQPICKWNIYRYLAYYRKVAKAISSREPLFQIFLFIMVVRIIQAVDYYKQFFIAVGIDGVVTMSDRHPNEYVITEVAKNNNIRTYTNQHGWFGKAVLPAYLPIASEKIFVWGDRSREHLLENNVDEKKIVVAGNSKFDRVYMHYRVRREEIRNAFIDKYHLNPNKLVLTYISAGIAPPYISYKDAFELFECFCQSADLAFNLVVKIRPAQDNAGVFRTWMKRLDVSEDRVLLYGEDLYEAFAATDIAVTSMTSAGIEAIGFGLTTIALNIIHGIDLKDFLSYNGDAIECNSRTEYRNTIERLFYDPEYFVREKIKAERASRKYFRNAENFNTSEFISKYIQQELH